jgi:uncharacterized HAD superfamily protein
MKRIAFDLDGTLTIQANIDFLDCNFYEREKQYKKMLPNKKMIKLINQLYREGNIVFIFTSRHLEHKKTTEYWLKKNKIKYYYAIYDKPYYDRIYDDKALTP